MKDFREATVIFSRATLTANHFLSSLAGYRRLIGTALPLARDTLHKENLEMVLYTLQDPKTAEVYVDPQGMLQSGKYHEFAQQITESNISTASGLVDASSLVFAHAVFDATLFEYCKACALLRPEDWIPLLKDRKVSLVDVQQRSRGEILRASIDLYLEHLERESMLKKADLIHRLIQPGEFRPEIRRYEYSRETLEQIDEVRHEAVHGLKFKSTSIEMGPSLAFLDKTVWYFVILLNFRYGLRIDSSVNVDI